MIRRLARGLLVVVFAALCSPRADAHDGPPYPIFVDESLDDWTVSIWTDPDVGTGTFFYYVDAPPGHSANEVVVHVSSVSIDERAVESNGTSERADPGEPFQLIGELEYDHRGLWQTTFRFERDAGGATQVLGELQYPLDVTPPGLGTFDILWFAFPFLAVGVLWLRALLAQRAYDRAPAPPDEPAN